VGARDFLCVTSVQTGLGVLLTSCKMGRGFFPRIEPSRCGVYHPPPRSAVHLLTLRAFTGMVQGDLIPVLALFERWTLDFRESVFP
jgi:hypothetical protein